MILGKIVRICTLSNLEISCSWEQYYIYCYLLVIFTSLWYFCYAAPKSSRLMQLLPLVLGGGWGVLNSLCNVYNVPISFDQIEQYWGIAAANATCRLRPRYNNFTHYILTFGIDYFVMLKQTCKMKERFFGNIA